MLVNPVLLAFGVLSLGMCGFFYVMKRPSRPYLSGVCLVLLSLFMGCTAVINAFLSPVSQFDWVNEQLRQLTPFVVFQQRPTVEECEAAFRAYQVLDVGLFALTIAAMAYDVWNSLIRVPQEEKG